MIVKKTNNKQLDIQNNNNNSLLHGVFQGVVQGISLGTGSTIANRTITALLDNKKDNCNEFFIKFEKCMYENNNEFSICKEILNNYEKCKI